VICGKTVTEPKAGNAASSWNLICRKHFLAMSRKEFVASTSCSTALVVRYWRGCRLGPGCGAAGRRAGHIGGTIGGLWVKAGHRVLFSSRHPEELKDLVTGLGSLAQAGTVAQAIAFGEALFIAVPYKALPQLGKEYGASFNGRVVLGACNAVTARDGPIAEEVEQNGIGLTSQKYLPGTRLVRASPKRERCGLRSMVDLRQCTNAMFLRDCAKERRRIRCKSAMVAQLGKPRHLTNTTIFYTVGWQCWVSISTRSNVTTAKRSTKLNDVARVAGFRKPVWLT
jgi:hypothetical protein